MVENIEEKSCEFRKFDDRRRKGRGGQRKKKKKNNAKRERAQIRSGTRSGAVVSSGIDRIDSMIFASRRVAVHMSDNRVR